MSPIAIARHAASSVGGACEAVVRSRIGDDNLNSAGGQTLKTNEDGTRRGETLPIRRSRSPSTPSSS